MICILFRIRALEKDNEEGHEDSTRVMAPLCTQPADMGVNTTSLMIYEACSLSLCAHLLPTPVLPELLDLC
jgi:hypothetical protein